MMTQKQQLVVRRVRSSACNRLVTHLYLGYSECKKKIHSLTPIRFIQNGKWGAEWLYRCDCGVEKIIRKRHVESGNSKSCGCRQREHARSGKAHFVHGLARSRFWNIFADIKRRTSRGNREDYARYGGRGIKCLWSSFQEYKKDMYRSYLAHIRKHGEDNTTIDRIDNDGHYSKENCRWATVKEQCNNTRRNKYLTHNGETKTYAQWEEVLGLPKKIVSARIKRGWSIKNALSKPKYAGKEPISRRNVL